VLEIEHATVTTTVEWEGQRFDALLGLGPGWEPPLTYALTAALPQLMNGGWRGSGCSVGRRGRSAGRSVERRPKEDDVAKESFELDSVHTVIGFSARHLGVTAVHGRFWRFSGWFIADREDLSDAAGEVTVEVASISTGEDQRDAHLRSPDFFAAGEFPYMTFRLTGIQHETDNLYLVDGDLTIRDITRPIRLRAAYGGEAPDPMGKGTRIGVSAAGRVDRMEFGLKWDGLAGAVQMVGNMIDIQIDAELIVAPLSARAALEAAAGMSTWIGRLNERELEDLQRALARMSAAVDQRLATLKGTSVPDTSVATPEPRPAEVERRRGLFGRLGRTG
jgi:polyisoprenoid-binding protein YceI